MNFYNNFLINQLFNKNEDGRTVYSHYEFFRKKNYIIDDLVLENRIKKILTCTLLTIYISIFAIFFIDNELYPGYLNLILSILLIQSMNIFINQQLKGLQTQELTLKYQINNTPKKYLIITLIIYLIFIIILVKKIIDLYLDHSSYPEHVLNEAYLLISIPIFLVILGLISSVYILYRKCKIDKSKN